MASPPALSRVLSSHHRHIDPSSSMVTVPGGPAWVLAPASLALRGQVALREPVGDGESGRHVTAMDQVAQQHSEDQ
jgi:hypothetical protein